MNTLQANHEGIGEEDLEIVFALVGPSGCDLGSVVRSLEAELRAASYIVSFRQACSKSAIWACKVIFVRIIERR